MLSYEESARSDLGSARGRFGTISGLEFRVFANQGFSLDHHTLALLTLTGLQL